MRVECADVVVDFAYMRDVTDHSTTRRDLIGYNSEILLTNDAASSYQFLEIFESFFAKFSLAAYIINRA